MLQQSHAYLRGHDAPDYWALSPYYVPQATDSACSVAAITMLLNALRALPPKSVDPLVTQQALLEKVANDQWAKETAQGGSGVTWDEFVADVRASLAAYGLAADADVLKPQDNSAATLAQVRRKLTENELSDRDIILVNFDQGVLTGDWDGPQLFVVPASALARWLPISLLHAAMGLRRGGCIAQWSGDDCAQAACRRSEAQGLPPL